MSATVTAHSYGKLPLAFEQNLGQTDPRVAFLARGSGFQAFITPTAAVYRFPGRVLRMELAGANGEPRIQGRNRLPGESHYLGGKTWVRHVPHYARVELRDVYPGIDLAYYGCQSQLEYDFILSPGADPRSIAIDVHGADGIEIDEQGALQIRTDGGQIRWLAPRAYQDDRLVRAAYVLRGSNRVGFSVARYDRARRLVIDPILAWSTLLGGTGHDRAHAVAVDAAESAVITGSAGSSDFPTTTGAYQTAGGGVFVSKLNATGSALVYSTFLGPGQGTGVALRNGNAYVTGLASVSATAAFPVTAGALNDSATGNNVFVSKLTADGSGLVYSALLGQGLSQGSSIAVDNAGNAYVTGRTGASNFPTTAGAFQPTRPTLGQVFLGDLDAFLVKLNSSGSALLYSTYLGSTNVDMGEHVAVDGGGNAYVVGSTTGRSASWQLEVAATLPFPTTAGAYQRTFVGGAAAFVTKFDPSASGAASVVYSTLLGGDDEADWASGVAVDGSGNAYVSGTAGANFPLTSGAYGSGTSESAAFVTRLNASGSGLLYSAKIPGTQGGGSEIALDSANNAFVFGFLAPSSTAFTPVNPLAGSFQDSLFLTKLNAAGSAAHYSTYMEGRFSAPIGVAVDPFGAAYVAGTAQNSFGATPGAYQTTLAGGTDGFASKVVTNRAPAANAGADQDVRVGVSFTLDGGGSSDPDGDTLSYVWKDANDAVVGNSQTLTLTRPQGVHTFTLTVSDGAYSASDTVTVKVETVLLVNTFGLVGGTVTSDDGKIDCPATGSAGCVARYVSPGPVTLLATPGVGVVFTGWTFDCSGAGNCTVDTGTDHIVGAQFAVQQLNLSVAPPANGKITSSAGLDCGATCSVQLPYGTVATLEGIPDPGYLFHTWGGNCSGTSSSCSVTMDSNKWADAAFKAITIDALSVTPAAATIGVGEHTRFKAHATFSDGSVRPVSGDHSLEAPDDYTCAITTNGNVKCWGGGFGTPKTVPTFEKAVALSAGTSHVCGLFADGTVKCNAGPFPGVTTATAIASESVAVCALLVDRSVRCWNFVGPPATVSGINNAIAIGAEGGGSACAVLADHSVSCWTGLGDGSSSGNDVPTPISGIDNAIEAAAGAEHACALLKDGTVKCWWRNNRGQLGDGSAFTPTSFTTTPVPVVNVSGAVSLVVGDYHSCVLLASGSVKCWGLEHANGRTIDSSTPMTISGLSNPAAVAAGAFHNCASFANGTVQCWGLNTVGQLGAGNPNSTTPLPVNGLSTVVSLSWTSGNSTVARIMASGRALGDASGTATLFASLGGQSANASLTVLNTPTGSNVTARPVDSATGATPVSVSYSSVTQAGDTTLTTSGSGPAPPSGFQLGNPPLYYEIATTASYTPPITVCIGYAGPSGAPQLFHYQGGAWVDVTSSVDSVHFVVCGTVSSLSPFALFQPADATRPEIRGLRAAPSVLWPPNHKLVPVVLSVDVVDDRDPNPACRIVSVSSNQPASGRKEPDWVVTGELSLMLRAERSNGRARVYTITVVCTDSSGKAALGTTTVEVAR